MPASASFIVPFVRRALPMGMLLVAVTVVPVLVLEPEGLPRMRGLEKELADVDAENADLKRDITKLRATVRELRDDPHAVEKIARDELGLVRKGEIVFQFPKPKE